MKRVFSFAQMGVSIISIGLWFLLPVFSFILVVPLFNISGWNLCMNINQIMLVPMAIGVLMLVAALINNRSLMIVSGILQVISIVLTMVFRKDILLGGNLKWIYSSAQILLNAIPNHEIAGIKITSDNLKDVVALITDNYMQMGIGLILHAICTLIYLLVAFIAPAEIKPFSSGTSGTGISGTANTNSISSFTPNTKTGYNHRT